MRVDANMKKKSILVSATRVFAKKGFHETTISDVAKNAGLSDSAVYKYFTGKEELLFTIPEEAMNTYLTNLEEQIEGIKGADNKLRKLITYQCRYITTNKDYTHIISLDCRSNKNFYASPAYKLVRDYSMIVIQFIKEGVEEGVFSDLWSPRLMRDMILGTINQVALNWIFNDTPSPIDRAESISELILKSIGSKKSEEGKLNSKAHKIERIIEAASKIFAEKGYEGATISEIAKEAKVADGTIYEYYQNKENLTIGIPEEKLLDLLNYIEDISPEKKLERLILSCFLFYNNNRHFTTILILLLRSNRKFYRSESFKIFDKIRYKIRDIIVEGREQGVFSTDFDIWTFCDLIFGTIDYLIIPWVMFKREYDLLKVGEEAYRLFLNAIRTECENQ